MRSYFRIPDSGESTEFVDEVTGFRRAYFKSTVADNPALSGTDYHRQLLDMPEAQKKALLHGDWTAHIGQVFSEWDYRRHTCEPFPIPCEWEIWRGCDDGFASPACALWLAHDKIHDRVYAIAELYQRGLTATELGRAVLEIDRSIPINLGGGEVIENDLELDGGIDSASFADVGMGGGRADQMNKLGCNWKPSAKGQDSRIAGKSQIHARLAMKSDGWPGLIVFRTCKNFIRTLPALCYDKARPEDVDSDAEDHAYDALRYGLTRKVNRCWTTKVRGL